MSACGFVVQIVTWNSAAVIDACLASLQVQDASAFELIVVDNASTDDTRERVRAAFARGVPGKLVESPCNEGFCGGQNRALAVSHAPWVLFLNPDATLPADFLSRLANLVATLDPEVGTIAPLILLADGRIDSSGLFLDRLRRVYDRGQGEFPPPMLREEDVRLHWRRGAASACYARCVAGRRSTSACSPTTTTRLVARAVARLALPLHSRARRNTRSRRQNACAPPSAGRDALEQRLALRNRLLARQCER